MEIQPRDQDPSRTRPTESYVALPGSIIPATSSPSRAPPPPPPRLPAQSHSSAPQTNVGAGAFPWSGLTRPLSDIRELSEPSIVDDTPHKPSNILKHHRSTSKPSSFQHEYTLRRVGSNRSAKPSIQARPLHGRSKSHDNGSSSYSTTPESPALHMGPYASIPQRSSSHTYTRPMKTTGSGGNLQSDGPTTTRTTGPVQKQEASTSPTKGVIYGFAPTTTREHQHRSPARTRVQIPYPSECMDCVCYKHPRVKVDLQVSAPLFVGGGSIEGHVRLTVDGNSQLRHRRALSIGTVFVDLIGLEQVVGNRKATFLALRTDLINVDHPPPPDMIEAVHPVFADTTFWPLAPSCTDLPFLLSLPLDTGPPPFQSRHASIRFLLAATAVLRDVGKLYRVRTSQDAQVLPTYDPEKALTSLPSPLTACDTVVVDRSAESGTVKLTASLHRQVWVSGSSIFVDVRISNRSRKAVKRLELALERDILCYKHTAAATLQKSASQARIFESNEQSVLATAISKPGTAGWDGVDAFKSDTRTCELALPRGHGTIRCGKYFEVRYFLNVTAVVSSSKQVSVQLPLILIHINSLDVVPNSIAQVAAAIEERRADLERKRSRSRWRNAAHARQRSASSTRGAEPQRRPSYSQGRAFAAPRQQSLDRLRQQQAEINELRNEIDASPRKYARAAAPGSSSIATAKKQVSSASLRSLAAPSWSRTRGNNENHATVLDGKTDGAASLDMRTEALRPSSSYCRLAQPTTFRQRLRSMRSFEAFRNRGLFGLQPKETAATAARRGQDATSSDTMCTRAASQRSTHQILPHTLGMGPARRTSSDGPTRKLEYPHVGRQASGTPDPGWFVFKAGARKSNAHANSTGSRNGIGTKPGGMRERSLNWWDVKRNGDQDLGKAGWI